MRVGERVVYVGDSYVGKALMEHYPEGGVVIRVTDGGNPFVRFASGAIVATSASGWGVVRDELEASWLQPAAQRKENS